MIIEFRQKITPDIFSKIFMDNNEFKFKLVDVDGRSLAITDAEIKQDDSLYNLLCVNPYVANVVDCDTSYQLVSKNYKNVFKINIDGKIISNNTFSIIAGPCSIESEEQIHIIAQQIAVVGANILRGGAYKARTSPYTFAGIGKQGVKYLRDAAKSNGMLSIMEVLDVRDIEYIGEHIDIVQIGSRNMHNFVLLKEVANTGKPILLKRGFGATYEEFLLAAEHICSEGNMNVILCERGIKTFENHTRNTLDICAVPVLQRLSFLPIFVDPSHGTGLRELVASMSLAAVASGANGVMLEVHTDPKSAHSDARQTISTEEFATLMHKVNLIRGTINSGVLDE